MALLRRDLEEEHITIHKAGLQDVPAISALTDAAYSKYIPLIGRQPQPMTADHAGMVTKGTVWLLEVDGHLAGVLELLHEPEALLIYSVAIQPEYQHQGFGHRLLAWAEQEALRAGYHSIRLYTNLLFVDNICLYRSLGYQETGQKPHLGSILVHMAKTLGN